MTSPPAPDLEDVQRTCIVCGHLESDHVVEDVDQETRKRERCLQCDNWHDFVPADD